MKDQCFDKNRFYLASAVTIIYAICINIPYYSSLASGDSIFRATLSSIPQLLVVWYILLLNRWVFLTLGLITITSSAALGYYTFKYKIIISVGLMRVITHADSREVSAFFEIEAIIYVLLSIIFTILIFVLSKKCDRISLKKLIPTISLCIAIFIFGMLIQPNIMEKNTSMPFIYYEHFYHYILEESRVNRYLNSKTDISNTYDFSIDNETNITIVLIIGESVRGDHLKQNGYHRDTTPFLSSTNAVSFTNAISCHVLTSTSIPCMLTRAELKNWDDSLKETSLISIFKRLGFETYWISNQGRIGHDKWVGSVALEANITQFCENQTVLGSGSLDICMLPYYKEAIKSDRKNKLIIVHTYGSHTRYDERYSSEHEVFSPVCIKGKDFSQCTGDELINVYDNSIIETDSFINKIIKELKYENALVFFVSDHAEPLGESGVRARGDLTSIYQRHIPFVVWGNGVFEDKKMDIIRQNRFKYVSHNNLIHSMLDCSNISSDFIDKDLSICNENMLSINDDPYFRW